MFISCCLSTVSFSLNYLLENEHICIHVTGFFWYIIIPLSEQYLFIPLSALSEQAKESPCKNNKQQNSVLQTTNCFITILIRISVLFIKPVSLREYARI